jgi:hypothetical protein
MPARRPDKTPSKKRLAAKSRAASPAGGRGAKAARRETGREAKSKAGAKAKTRVAERRLKEAEDGLLKGTHTLEQFEEAARELFATLDAEGVTEPMIPIPDKFGHDITLRRTGIAKQLMSDTHRLAEQGLLGLEEIERSVTATHRFMAERQGGPSGGARWREIAKAEASALQQRAKRVLTIREKEEARRRREAERAEAVRLKLAAQAADKKLSEARREAARAKLEDERQEAARDPKLKLYAAQKKSVDAFRRAEYVAMGLLIGAYDAAEAEETFRALSEAERELREIGLEFRLKEFVRQHVARARQRLEEKATAERILSEETKALKKKRVDEACEYRFVVPNIPYSDWRPAYLVKVCINRNGNVTRAALKGLHPFLSGLLKAWGSTRLQMNEKSLAALTNFRERFSRVTIEPGRNVLEALRSKLGGDFYHLLGYEPLYHYGSAFDRVLYNARRALSEEDFRRIQNEFVSELGEMLRAFKKQPLPSSVID